MTVFRPGMRVKRIYRPDLRIESEIDYVGRITNKGFIKLQSDLADPYFKYRLIRPDGRSPLGSFVIVPDHDEELTRLSEKKQSLLRELDEVTGKIHTLENEMDVTEDMWSHKRVE